MRRMIKALPLECHKKVVIESIGSGVIIDPKNGVIVTNDHVIRKCQPGHGHFARWAPFKSSCYWW